MTSFCKQQLTDAGMDVADALERLMGSETLLERLLKKFLEDENYQKLCTALECADQEAAVAAAHTLKGVCGNLSLTVLYPLFTRQVEVLRQGDWPTARTLMEEIQPAYLHLTEAVRSAVDCHGAG